MPGCLRGAFRTTEMWREPSPRHHAGIDALPPPRVCLGHLPSGGSRLGALFSTYPQTWWYSSPNALTFADVSDPSPHAILLRPSCPSCSVAPCSLQLAAHSAWPSAATPPGLPQIHPLALAYKPRRSAPACHNRNIHQPSTGRRTNQTDNSPLRNPVACLCCAANSSTCAGFRKPIR